MDARAAPATPSPGDLARLLDTERRLDERLLAARAEAAALIEHARADAAARDAALTAELENEARGEAAVRAAERERREDEIAAAAERAAGAYEAISADRVAAVARDLAARLVASEEDSP